MKREVLVIIAVILLLGIVFASTFTDNSQANFNNGTYSNTGWNGSAVVLSSGQTSGTFTSRIFNAGADSTWNNLTEMSSEPNLEILFTVDLSGAVYTSNNSGLNWTQQLASGYTRTTDGQDMFSDNNGNIYILTNTNKEVWKSTDSGATWSVVNKTFSSNNLFAGDSDNNGNLFVAAGTGTGLIFKSSDNGLTWTTQNSSLNLGTSATTKGITSNKTNALFLVSGAGKVF